MPQACLLAGGLLEAPAVAPVPLPHGCSPPPPFSQGALLELSSPWGRQQPGPHNSPPTQALPAACRSGAGHVRQVLWLLGRNCLARD